MNSRRNKNSGYLVALLLVVGLVAFSNSMRELAEIHQFTLDTSRLVAQFFVPAELPQIPQIPETPQIPQVVVAKLNSCEASAPAPLPKVERVAPRVRVKSTEAQLAKLEKLRQFEFHEVPFAFNPTQFEFKIATDDKAKNRKQNIIKLNTRDREMILRTLNRSINLRTAS